ncbi:MAG TPA: phosphatase PAP2 family protein [Aggregatilinea sp.]|jgi:membrane-associated phospholipid phosphatase|uniref:phosphatase PAP2 family protein n=1 Tax=Aggregatilinea sp. TaxID=2806333 RepID=UPI002CEF9338|nr:phosphatase PAP2 family protein [Aggregatilinea sp.]HML20353.1 phosphatase PAP2 family protein [Aggregatilinea sp.]
MHSLDVDLFHYLNELVARSPAMFESALEWTDRAPWVIAALLFVAFWFYGRPGVLATEAVTRPRVHNRRVLILVLIGMWGMAIAGPPLRHLLDRPRPLVSETLDAPVEPDTWVEIRATYDDRPSFPSVPALVFFVLATGLFALNAAAGIGSALLFALLLALEVGLGLAWPSDVVSGACIGFLWAVGLLRIEPWVRHPLTRIVLLFEHNSAPMYVAGFFVLLDLSYRFAAISYVLRVMAGYGIR